MIAMATPEGWVETWQSQVCCCHQNTTSRHFGSYLGFNYADTRPKACAVVTTSIQAWRPKKDITFHENLQFTRTIVFRNVNMIKKIQKTVTKPKQLNTRDLLKLKKFCSFEKYRKTSVVLCLKRKEFTGVLPRPNTPCKSNLVELVFKLHLPLAKLHRCNNCAVTSAFC